MAGSLGALLGSFWYQPQIYLKKIEIRPIRPPFFPSFGHLRREAGLCPGLCHGRPEPTQTHEAKFSPWAPKDVIYAFYDNPLLARAHQQLTPYKNSKFYHARTGMQKDARTAETLGTLNVNRIHCACESRKAPL